MDVPGYPLSRYERIHPRLRPELDLDLVDALLALVEAGSPAVTATRKAKRRLDEHLELAKARRDIGLPRRLREAVRLWEETHGLDTTNDTNTKEAA